MDTLDVFTGRLLKEYEDENMLTLTPASRLRESEYWTSMHALITLAFVNTEYNVTLTGEELRSVQTIEELYRLVTQKRNGNV